MRAHQGVVARGRHAASDSVLALTLGSCLPPAADGVETRAVTVGGAASALSLNFAGRRCTVRSRLPRPPEASSGAAAVAVAEDRGVFRRIYSTEAWVVG